MNIHKKLKKARLEAGLSQKQLAELMNVEQCKISIIESGKQDTKISTIEKVLQALGLTIKFDKL